MDRWEIETTLNNSRSWLLEQFAGMTADQLTQPATQSDADPGFSWNALDHLIHLAGPEEQAVEAIARQVAGDEYPYQPLVRPSGRGLLPREEFLPIVHGINDRWVREHRTATLDEAVALGQGIRGRMLRLLSELSPAQLAEPLRNMPWTPMAPTIADLFLLMARHERGHHQSVVDGWAGGAKQG